MVDTLVAVAGIIKEDNLEEDITLVGINQVDIDQVTLQVGGLKEDIPMGDIVMEDNLEVDSQLVEITIVVLMDSINQQRVAISNSLEVVINIQEDIMVDLP